MLVHRATFVRLHGVLGAGGDGDRSVVHHRRPALPGVAQARRVLRLHGRGERDRRTRYRRRSRRTATGCTRRSSPGAQHRPNGQPDLRLTTKVALAPAPRTLNNLTGTYKPVMYNDPSDRAARPRCRHSVDHQRGAAAAARGDPLEHGEQGGSHRRHRPRARERRRARADDAHAASSDDAFVTELLYNRTVLADVDAGDALDRRAALRPH